MRNYVACAVVVSSLVASNAARAMPVPVADAAALTAAIAAAKAGDEIILAPGTYALAGANCTAVGTSSSPIIVRAQTPLSAHIEFNALEGFKVSGAYWHFEGIDIKGTCPNDADCEHAFHVFGAADGFQVRLSRIFDFNAQIKVNAAIVGATMTIPNLGLVEGNEFGDAHARNTTSPVTKINIDTGDGWIVRANYIHDFHKVNNDPTYGAFMKSGGHRGVFERNLVLCSRDYVTSGGVYIGLSFGGGGTGAQFCAPAFDANVPCDVEHTDGMMRNNIIATCTDVGVYINRGKNTRVFYNTLVGTSGVDYRFSTTTGEARGNVLASAIRARDGATFNDVENMPNVAAATFAGWYKAPTTGDLRIAGDVSALVGKGSPVAAITDDYCARARGANKLDFGALQHSLGDCDTTRPPIGSGGGADAGVNDASTGDSGGIGPGVDGGPSGGSDGGGATNGATPANDSGCGCRVARSQSCAPIALALAGVVVLARRRRRAR